MFYFNKYNYQLSIINYQLSIIFIYKLVKILE